MRDEAEKYPGFGIYYVEHQKRAKCFYNSTSTTQDLFDAYSWPFVDLQYAIVEENNDFTEQYGNNLTVKELGIINAKLKTVNYVN